MISELLLENFQSHVSTRVHLSPYVNVFIGPSMSGKSAILRAVRFLIYNRPSRGTFCSSGMSSISAVFDGGTVVREKGKNRNAYIVDGVKLAKIGLSLPEEVMQITDVHPIFIQENVVELLYSGQFDSPFLLAGSSIFSSSLLTFLGDIQRLSACVASLSGERRQCSDQIRVWEAETARCEESLESYTFLQSFEESLVEVERLDAAVQQLSQRVQQGEVYVQAGAAIAAAVPSLKRELALYADIPDVETVSASFWSTSRRIEIGEQLSSRAKVLLAGSAAFQAELALYEGLPDIPEFAAALAARIARAGEFVQQSVLLEERIASMSEELSLIEELPGEPPVFAMRDLLLVSSDLTVDISRMRVELKSCETELQEVLSEIEDALRSAKKCPYCFAELSPERVEEVLHEVLRSW